ncbi:MAG TPA: ParB N-terminal domain-containing protein [Pirellulales bacterium]|jgi:hypothetical protein
MTLGPIQRIPISKIKRGTDIRDNADPSRAAGLVATLKDGQLMPVIVWQDDDWFHLVDGHRRFDATVSLGLETIEARVLDKPPGNGEALQKALICNTQREALSPLALARAIADLIEATGWTAAEAATLSVTPQPIAATGSTNITSSFVVASGTSTAPKLPGPDAFKLVFLKNLGTGNCVIAADSGSDIYPLNSGTGASSLTIATLHSCILVSDGTRWLQIA